MNHEDSSELTGLVDTTVPPGRTWSELFVEGDADKIRNHLQDELNGLFKKWSRRLQNYNVILFYNDDGISSDDADDIYRALSAVPSRKKDLLMVLVSGGGSSVPAYQISKLCREWSKDRFIIAVPRHASSAATLICLGADAVHMGPLGYLGPIDPQIYLPEGKWTAGLAHQRSLQTITKWVAENPGSQRMWAEIVSRDRDFNLFDIGEYERDVESSVQYAERLLIAGKSSPERATEIAKHLTYAYKEHIFAIDRDEAKQIFGEDSVVRSSKELLFSEEVYRLIVQVDKGLKAIKHDGNNVVHGGVKVVGAVHESVTVLPPPSWRLKRVAAPENEEQG